MASRRWTGWAAGVARHRWLATLAALAVLVPLCVAALGLRLGDPPAAVLAQSGPAREALDRLERAGVGSGVLTPIEVLVPAGTDRRAVADHLGGVAGVLLAAVAVITFVLLARAFRSLLLALKAIVLNLLSLGAAYGVLVLVWQEGTARRPSGASRPPAP